MAFKVIVLMVLGMILISLGSSLFFMLHDEGNSRRAVKALTIRIGLSLALFALLMLAYAVGWIVPNSVQFVRP